MYPTKYFFNIINTLSNLYQDKGWWQRFLADVYTKLTLKSVLSEYIFYIVILIFLTLLCLKIMRVLLKTKSDLSTLGKLPLTEIKYLKDIVLEVHYAACYCGTDPSLIRRCKSLLEVYPAACNIPMHGHNYTPFLRACWNGCAELIAFMIRIGANIEATTDAGEGAIYLATYCAIKKKSNDFTALKILLAAGLDINHARGDGLTALDVASLKGHRRLQRWLIAHGATPTGVRTKSVVILKGHSDNNSYYDNTETKAKNSQVRKSARVKGFVTPHDTYGY